MNPDVVMIGSGPNGLVAACVLAQRGLRVLVLEANRRRPGGALGTEELTLPGYLHDVGAGFFPFGRTSPAFRALGLEALGVTWLNAKFESCHSALDGSYACIARDPELGAASFGGPWDDRAWRELARWHAQVERELLDTLLLPFPALAAAFHLDPGILFKLVRLFARSGRSLAESLFESEAARRVLPSLALHVDVGPDDRFGAGLGYMLGLTASTGGYADTAAPALFLELLDPSCVPRHILERMRRYPMGWGTFKLDWALSAPVPWAVEQARESAVVHAGESVDDLARFTREVRAVKCQSGRTSWSGSRVSSTGAARRPIAIRSTATRTCPHSPRAVGTPSANASRIWSKRGSNSSRRAFVRRSWPGRFRRPPTWKGRTQTSLAASVTAYVISAV